MKITNQVKRFCPFCMKAHSVNLIFEKVTTIFKEEPVKYTAEYFFCKQSEEIWEDEALLISNDISMKDAYRSIQGLLTSKEIVSIRKQYGVSQTDFCKILGWGGKTIARYETHQVQSKAHDIVLRKIKDDPEWFLCLLDEQEDLLSKVSYKKYKQLGEKLYEKQSLNYEKKFIKAVRLSQKNKNLSNNNMDYISLAHYKAFNESVQRKYITQLDGLFSSLPCPSDRNMRKCVASREGASILSLSVVARRP